MMSRRLPRNGKKYNQGIYRPQNPIKYMGRKNPRYLSSWELKFFRWCDNNTNVIKWGSESFAIPYISPIDNRLHKYLVDNVVHIKEGSNIVKYLVEIKPKKQTLPPTKHGNKKPTTIIYENQTYAVNTAKWKSAKAWCNKNKYRFIILTEDQLF